MYKTIAYHTKYENGQKIGELFFETDFLIYKNENERISFEISSISIESGGESNSVFYIKSTLKPDWVFVTSDKKLLKDKALLKSENLKTFIQKVNNRKRFYASLALAFIGIVVALFIGLFALKGAFVKYIASKIPVSFEKEMGDKLFNIAINGKKIIEDTLLNKYLQQATVPLVKAVNDSNYKFTFYIVDDTVVNAFALPGGHVVINSGLLKQADSFEELCGVLAHELSHVTLRHHVRGQLNNVGMMVLLSGITGDESGITSSLLQGSAQLALLKYSREMETESDENGWDYLLNAKINPEGMIVFFQKMEKENAEHANIEAFLSTHPETAERIKVLEEKKSKLKINDFYRFNLDYTFVKERLKSMR